MGAVSVGSQASCKAHLSHLGKKTPGLAQGSLDLAGADLPRLLTRRAGGGRPWAAIVMCLRFAISRPRCPPRLFFAAFAGYIEARSKHGQQGVVCRGSGAVLVRDSRRLLGV